MSEKNWSSERFVSMAVKPSKDLGRFIPRNSRPGKYSKGAFRPAICPEVYKLPSWQIGFISLVLPVIDQAL
jgi:hypothetical protein